MTVTKPELARAFQTHAGHSKKEAAIAASRAALALSMVTPGEPRAAAKFRRRWMNNPSLFRRLLERAANKARA